MENKHKIYIKKPKKCNHCHHHQEENMHTCPKCGFKGIEVLTKTVKNLSYKENIKDDEVFYICTNRGCDVVYFSNNQILEKEDIKTKIWYKGPIEEFIVCYCHNITLLDIIKAVTILKGSNEKVDILKVLNKDLTERNCELYNPISQNCDKLFNNAVEYAVKAYNASKGEEDVK